MEYNGYRITSLDTYSMVKIQPKGSGDIPNELKGLFTNREFAKKQIDRYLGSLTNRRKASVKEKRTATN